MQQSIVKKTKNEYQIIDFSSTGLPFVEVHGNSFCYEDLYELSGKHGFMTTFNMKDGSLSYSKFGKHLTGVISYPSKNAEKKAKQPANQDKLKISCFDHQLSSEIVEDLKYGGLNISDIESISFLPLKRGQNFHETGEKKVPNIIEIELRSDELAGIDVDKLQQSLLLRKNNDGVKLADFEKEELIGITLALNNGHIDSRILQHFGFNKETMMSNINIFNKYYEIKERQGHLTDSEKEKYTEIKDIIRIQRMIKLLQEIEKSGTKSEELSQNQDTLKEIFDSVVSFRPHVLLLGKMQVYWDVDSYIHIVMRHYQKYQLGSFKGKTSFSYKVKDLETLIEKVLGAIKEEYKTHASKKPGSSFKRDGTMAVEFNGDHYTVRITSEGRLEQFHAW